MENLLHYLRENVKVVSDGKEYIGFVNTFSEAEENYDNEDSIVLVIKDTEELVLFLASDIDSIEII